MRYNTGDEEMRAAFGRYFGEKCRNCTSFEKGHCSKTKSGVKCPTYGDACGKFTEKER